MNDHSVVDRKRTNDIRIEDSITFQELVISEEILRAIDEIGYVRPSPIQLKAIPLGVAGSDLIAQAKSGTGKTAVFGIIAIEHVLRAARLFKADMEKQKLLMSNRELMDLDDERYAEVLSGVPRHQMVLIVSPTREISVQISQVISQLAKHCARVRAEVFIGGVRESDDVRRMKGTQIVVGTPGRIKSLIESLELRTDAIKLLILDEADKLLDPAFTGIVNWIVSTLPKERQTLAFSATYPEFLVSQLEKLMKSPVQIRLCSDTPSLEGIKQYYQVVALTEAEASQPSSSYLVFKKKFESILLVLKQVSFYQMIIFCNYKSRAEELSKLLNKEGWPTCYISGDQGQKERNQTMEALKNFQLRVLVSTDLISRGIDIERVNLVINLDVPKDYETYFHRIGRTGRFGSYGVAISFLGETEKQFLRDLIEIYSVALEARKDNDPIPEEYYTYALPSETDQISLNKLIKKQEKTLAKREKEKDLQVKKPKSTGPKPKAIERSQPKNRASMVYPHPYDYSQFYYYNTVMDQNYYGHLHWN